MNNSNSYWDKTINDFEQSFCQCECVKDQEEENILPNEQEKFNLNNKNEIDIDNLFTDKRNKENINSLQLDDKELNGKILILYYWVSFGIFKSFTFTFISFNDFIKYNKFQ